MKSLNKIVLFDIDYTLFDTTLFKESALTKYALYDEVIPLLSKLATISELGIFSKGEEEFQKTKLQKTGIEKYFELGNIHIFEDKDSNMNKIIKQYEGNKIYLVDDKLEILFNAKKINPSIVAIWVKRGPFAQDEKLLDNFSPDITVVNLKEIISIISD